MYVLKAVMKMPGHDDEVCIVATFDSEEKAHEYIKKATLKSSTFWRKKFSKKSLLGGYDDAYVDYVDWSYEHNPEI
jgi:hypothetical protein